jgi:flagellar hook-associated protein 2
MFTSNIRMSGLASGMDIDQLVNDLMKAERIPLDKLHQKKQLIEWKRDAYREMNSLLKELDDMIFNGIDRQSTFVKKLVSSSDESKVTAVANSLVSNVTTQIEVTQLASSSYGVSGTISIDSNNKIDPNATLSSQSGKFKNNNFGTSFELKVFQPDGTFKQQTFSIDPSTESLNDILKKINDSDLGVTAFYDEFSDKISISTNHTGQSSTGVEIEVLNGTFFSDALQFTSNQLATNGKNAKYTINGLSTENASNTFTVNGITYTLKDVTTSPVTISTKTDTDAIFNSIKEFVDNYNEVIRTISSKLSEERFRDYLPLTDLQKEEMTEKQIELWEEKAKSGLLRSDSILTRGLSQLRIDLYTKVDGINTNYDQLSEIGITTKSFTLSTDLNGELVIDESKLRKAIEDNPDAVYDLFNASGTTYETKGIASRLRDTITTIVRDIEAKAGNVLKTEYQYSLGKSLIDLNNRIHTFEDRLMKIEDRYWKQFTAMEKAINQFNSQAMYIMNAFGGGMG